MTRLELEPGAADLDFGGLRAQRIGLAVELLRQELEAPPGWLRLPQQIVRRGDMGAEPVELFLDIGLGGEEQRLLVQPFRIESGAGLHQPAHLLGKARGNHFRLARRG